MATLIAKIHGNTRGEIAENLRELASDIENGTDDNAVWDGLYDYDLVKGKMEDINIRFSDINICFSDDLQHTKLI